MAAPDSVVEEIRRRAQGLGQASPLGRFAEGMSGIGQALSSAYDRAKSAAASVRPYLEPAAADAPTAPTVSPAIARQRPALGRPRLGRSARAQR